MKKDFYPTPKSLLDKIFSGVKWRNIQEVLEPSAGMGDIADYIRDAGRNCNSFLTVDCIEIDPELRNILKGKNHHVVHDDFLTFHTYKQYDLIVMNPPFSEGDKHLLKALEIMEEAGGDIVCILNAETLRNPYTNVRKDLARKLEDVDAAIEYMTGQFENAVRRTSVEIAVIKVHMAGKIHHSAILSGLREKHYRNTGAKQLTDLAVDDVVEAAIQQYNFEVEAGLRLIQEYQEMEPYLDSSLGSSKYCYPMIEMKLNQGRKLTANGFVELVRRKYWSALFKNERFTKGMTSNLRNEYLAKVNELAAYDFSHYNILTIQESMCRELVRGVEDCIVQIFDELSYQYSYESELSKNIHYYNGWKTNKSWIINKKVIMPWMNAFGDYSWQNKFEPTRYNVWEKLSDIEKALNYLDSGRTDVPENASYDALREAEQTGTTRKIHLKFFDVTFYKKGTCHLEFRDLELLKKLNIFGSQQKGWLPPSYGKKHYRDMDAEEQRVIDDFEGMKSYEMTLAKADYYLFDSGTAIPVLEDRMVKSA